MLFEQIILILDSQKTEAYSYTDIVRENFSVHLISSDNPENISEIVEKYEPDLIIAYNNFNQDIVEICSNIRNQKTLHRPVLIVLSDEISLEKKLEIIKSGADDFQSLKLSDEEIALRIFAHLRRQEEEFSNTVTKLPSSQSAYKIIKRTLELNNKEFIAVMYLSVDNFIPYNDIYGCIAADKLIQTFVAIIKTSINENDFLGQINENSFIVISKPEKAEKIATFLNYSFDIVAPKFYSEEDAEKGYIISSGDDKIGRRIPFVSVSIGIASNQHRNYSNYQEVLSSSVNIQRLAKVKSGSSWLSDRPRISGGDIVKETPNKILIMEKDAALAYLLSTTLEMKNYIVETANNINDVIENVEKDRPNLILLDIEDEESAEDLDSCKAIKENYPDIKIIISSAARNKSTILDSGVDLYIPKPYELVVLYSWIDRLLNDDFN